MNRLIFNFKIVIMVNLEISVFSVIDGILMIKPSMSWSKVGILFLISSIWFQLFIKFVLTWLQPIGISFLFVLLNVTGLLAKISKILVLIISMKRRDFLIYSISVTCGIKIFALAIHVKLFKAARTFLWSFI